LGRVLDLAACYKFERPKQCAHTPVQALLQLLCSGDVPFSSCGGHLQRLAIVPPYQSWRQYKPFLRHSPAARPATHKRHATTLLCCCCCCGGGGGGICSGSSPLLFIKRRHYLGSQPLLACRCFQLCSRSAAPAKVERLAAGRCDSLLRVLVVVEVRDQLLVFIVANVTFVAIIRS